MDEALSDMESGFAKNPQANKVIIKANPIIVPKRKKYIQRPRLTQIRLKESWDSKSVAILSAIIAFTLGITIPIGYLVFKNSS